MNYEEVEEGGEIGRADLLAIEVRSDGEAELADRRRLEGELWGRVKKG